MLAWTAQADNPATEPDPDSDNAPRILVLGDSLSAAYGIETGAGWVTLLQQRLNLSGRPHRILNASISGETTAGGRARLPALLRNEQFTLVILELGGNDGLRGLLLPQTEANLRAMIETARDAGAEVLLIGMRLPPNYGRTYTEAFSGMYRELATALDVPLVPFLLDGVATVPDLMQADRIHPRAEAQPRLLENVWPVLRPLL